MLADAAAAAAAADCMCIDAAAACTACMMSGGYLLPGAAPGGKAGGCDPVPICPGPKWGYGRGVNGPKCPAAFGNKGNPVGLDGDPPFGCPDDDIPEPGRCILYIASNNGWIGLG